MSIKQTTSTKVAMVGYQNTLPFVYGLEQANSGFSIIKDIPSRCMDYFSDGRVDIALVPVATLIDAQDYNIVSDYCIGCDGEVLTVCIYGNKPIDEVEKIYLDAHSRSSQMLTRVLAENYWKLDFEYEEVDISELSLDEMKPNEAVLMIGDKVFENEGKFDYKYDLGAEWKKHTGLPFAFAVWIARDTVSETVVLKLNEALGHGIENISEVIATLSHETNDDTLKEYFQRYIDYKMDSHKRQAIDLFLSHAVVAV